MYVYNVCIYVDQGCENWRKAEHLNWLKHPWVYGSPLFCPRQSVRQRLILFLLVKTRIILVWRFAPWERTNTKRWCVQSPWWQKEDPQKWTVPTGALIQNYLVNSSIQRGTREPVFLSISFAGFQNSPLLKNFMGIKPGRNYRGKKIKPEKTEQERKATYYQYSWESRNMF